MIYINYLSLIVKYDQIMMYPLLLKFGLAKMCSFLYIIIYFKKPFIAIVIGIFGKNSYYCKYELEII